MPFFFLLPYKLNFTNACCKKQTSKNKIKKPSQDLLQMIKKDAGSPQLQVEGIGTGPCGFGSLLPHYWRCRTSEVWGRNDALEIACI